ncbi:NAD(P)/FAD-dependent oxidoreductase [Pseudotabrizicola algicola]|uniref:FAD-binding oxidoreductase n=1 Tax=Pseudotabrizicola algicola TaxID=2709381 RepID=A0A6B3RNB0_9RHOB|nr:FAD-dependent oxidoreductase [Pseudotabrizicola algicola]NEX46686.1 FAD-binding oxidoreductase [Pseudotabrizicola algicola]
MRADVLVIGAGITGMMAALHLADAGAEVRLVDAGENAGTWANAGSLHVQMQSRFMRLYPDQVPAVEASLPLYKAAAEEWVRLDALYGPFELVRKGGLMLAEGADQLRFLEGKARREAAQGLSVEILDRAALDRFAPWLGPQIVGAELCRDEGKLNPLIANARLMAELARRGVQIMRDRVVRLEHRGDGVMATGRNAAYRADQVIVASAWGAGEVVQDLGVAIPTKAEPLHMNITEAAAVSIGHLIQHAERSITLKQLGQGQIVIGGGWPARDRGRDMPPEVLAASLLGNVALAARLVPQIGGLRVIRTWAGMNTTADGASTIGRLPEASRVVMALPGDAGYTLGPLVARLAAGVALGTVPDGEVAGFAPARFAA